ncbi:MAG: hypothetical protein K2H12_00860 [Acetatifactor sp.]|nr:hypothetical protein [Acetatifactor sp.]
MPEDRDYDIVVGKLPRKDKDGKDTTGDKIGRGGRHREDGTYSSVVYDIEVVDNLPERNEVDYKYELERMAHEERMAEVQKSQSTAEAITSGLDFINTILTFFVENPEVLNAAIDFGRKAKNGISSAKNKLVLAVRNGKQQKNKKVIKETVPETKIMDTVIVSQISTETVPDDMDMSQIEMENISFEKSRELILGILMD